MDGRILRCGIISVEQGSDTRVRTQKNPVGFFWVHPPKKPTTKKTHTSTLT